MPDYSQMAKWLMGNWDAPARAYNAQSPTADFGSGLLGNFLTKAHQAIDPVNGMGGYGGLLAMALPPGEAPFRRFDIGKAMSAAERKKTLDSLADVYKDSNLQKVSKGTDSRGEEIFGYPHTPELFRKSDITGAQVRHYVTLPDGKIAHPTELFPDYTQSHIEAAMREKTFALKQAKASAEKQLANQFDNRADANYYWNMKAAETARKYGKPSVYAAPQRIPLTNKDGKIILIPKDSDQAIISTLGDMGWKPSNAPAS